MVESNSKEIFKFLRELAANNDRSWFAGHKARYDELRSAWESDIQRLIDRMAQYDDSLRGLQAKQSVYRIYRDVRFSPDKSPYKTYFGALIVAGGRHGLTSCNYLHMSPGESMLAGGVWRPEKDKLDALRSLIDAEPEEWTAIAGKLEVDWKWECETLRTMPKGWPREHELARYIKMKEYTMFKRVGEDYFDGDWVERVACDFEQLMPLHQFLNYVYEDY